MRLVSVAHPFQLSIQPDGRLETRPNTPDAIGPWELLDWVSAPAPWGPAEILWSPAHDHPAVWTGDHLVYRAGARLWSAGRYLSVQPDVGALRIADGETGFVDDGGLVLPVFCHAGDLLALYARVAQWALAELDDIQAAGYHGVRTWTELSGEYWDPMGRSIGPGMPGYHQAVGGFANALRVRGLRWMVSQGWRITPAMMTDLAATLRDAGGLNVVAAVDGGNEAWHLDENTPEHLRRCVDAFRAVLPVPIWSLTSPGGDDKAGLDRYAGSVYDLHGPRNGHWWDKIRYGFSTAYETKPARRLGIQSEPPGPNAREEGGLVSGMHNWAEMDAEMMGLLHAMHLMSRQATVYFSSPGVSVRERGEFSRQPGFSTVPALARLLPNDLMSWPTILHGSSAGRWLSASTAADGGIVRVDQAAASDGRRMGIAYGPSGRHQIPVEGDCELSVIDPGTLTQTPLVRFQAGERLPLEFTRGRIVLGQLV